MPPEPEGFAAAPNAGAGAAQRATNLADVRIGAAAISCSDEFFGPMSRMLEPQAPVFFPDR